MSKQMMLTEVVPKGQQIVTKEEFLKLSETSVLKDRIDMVGPDKLLNHEYLSIMTGIDAEKLRGYIWKYGLTELAKVAGALDITSQQQLRLLMLYETCRRIGSVERNLVKVTSPDDASAIFLPKLRYHAVEIFMAAFLDTRNHIITVSEISRGTVSETIVSHGTVLKMAVNLNARGVVVAHNHPSGSPEPSGNDKSTTIRLKETLKLVSVSLLDHIIVGGSNFVSMKQEGLL